MYIYIYMYIEREIENNTSVYVCVYIYIYMGLLMFNLDPKDVSLRAASLQQRLQCRKSLQHISVLLLCYYYAMTMLLLCLYFCVYFL